MNYKRNAVKLIFGALLLLAVLTPVAAEEDQDKWRITVAPYLLGAFMNGTVGVRGVESEVDMSASDIFSKLKFGFNGYFEAKKGKWGFGTDIIYMNLGTYSTSPHVNVDCSQGAYSFAGLREVRKNVDLVFGLRWNVIKSSLFFFDKVGPIAANTEFKQTKQWIDPLVGIKMLLPVSEKLNFGLSANLAGFGISSKIVVDIFPTLQFKVGKHASLGAGYRFMYTNYKNGYKDVGRQPDAFKYDMISQGPVIGMTFRY